MGIFRATLACVLALAFLAALGNLAFSMLAEPEQAAELSPPPAPIPIANSPAPQAPSGKEETAPSTPLSAVQALFGRAVSATPSPGLQPAHDTLSQAQIDAIQGAWQGWMAEHGLTTGAMALALPDGQIIGLEIGRAPTDPAPVASLSKAITGLCLDGILAEQGLSWNTTLGDIAAEMSAAGVTPRAWNEEITLGRLVTHSAGLSPDYTQGSMNMHRHGALGLHRRVASEALSYGAIHGTAGTFFYSNTNYAVLGVVIEALSGRSYAEACTDQVMTPAGVTDAVIHGRNGALSSFAGWEISAQDYARLARYWFTPGQPHLDAPTARPIFGEYAMGYHIIGSGRSAAVSHNGVICIDQFMRSDHGATFLALGTGTVFSANWDGCVQAEDYDVLLGRVIPHLR